MDTPGCFHQATGGSSLTPPPHPRGVKFTRMIQHQLIILQPRLLLSPSAHLEAVEITPPEPVTLFNDMSGQNVTSLCEKAWGGGGLL